MGAIQGDFSKRVEPLEDEIDFLMGDHLARDIKGCFVLPVLFVNPLEVAFVGAVKRVRNESKST